MDICTKDEPTAIKNVKEKNFTQLREKPFGHWRADEKVSVPFVVFSILIYLFWYSN